MKNRRFRPLIFAGIALVAVWVVASTIFHFAAESRMTAEKLDQYTESVDLAALSGAGREQAISRFESMINALTYEERVKWRLGNDWKKWFNEMTEAERLKFVEATLPTGLKQTLDAFSNLPADQRKHIIDQSIKNLQQEGAGGIDKSAGDYGKNGPPTLSPELEQKVREMGLKEIYSDSSAETKAELAPLLEQMQELVRNGRMH